MLEMCRCSAFAAAACLLPRSFPETSFGIRQGKRTSITSQVPQSWFVAGQDQKGAMSRSTPTWCRCHKTLFLSLPFGQNELECLYVCTQIFQNLFTSKAVKFFTAKIGHLSQSVSPPQSNNCGGSICYRINYVL